MKIRFSLTCPTQWGEAVYLTGSPDELGRWSQPQAIRMNYSEGGIWHSEIDFPGRLSEFEYQYFIRHDDGRSRVEGGAKRKFWWTANHLSFIHLRDRWQAPADPDVLFLSSAFSEVIFGRKKMSTPRNLNLSRVRLQILAPRIAPEDSLFVTGSHPLLGNWDPKKALPMSADRFPFWTLDLPIAGNETFSYKYLIKKEAAPFYETGPDRILSLTAESQETLTIITDNKFRYAEPWRGAGVAIPLFSLRTRESLGIGEFLDLKLLADWTAKAGLELIQLLPVNDTTVHMNWLDSYPYSGLSVFALHPIYLNLEAIGLLPTKVALEITKQKKLLDRSTNLEYDKVARLKFGLLREIFKPLKAKFLTSGDFAKFLKENSFWLPAYAAFSALRDHYKTSDYSQWKEWAHPTEADIVKLTAPKSPFFDSVAFYYFLQYHAHLQLKEASDYARSKGVILKGDIPIGLSKTSDSCWTTPGIFNLNASAGAPPDFFSEEGQNWGFPTYNWNEMSKNGFEWWRHRLGQMSRYFQMIRLDHILGFFRIWEIPDHSVSGILGRFNPAIPLWREEFESQGIWDFDRLTNPYITLDLLKNIFGVQAPQVAEKFFIKSKVSDRLAFKSQYNTQKKLEAALGSSGKDAKLKTGLMALVTNVILIPETINGRLGFHPRINMAKTSSFERLEFWIQEKLKALYEDYFYHRQEDFWAAQAMVRLPAIQDASQMLIAGEDLGMIPVCVASVMEKLSLIGLRIERMPRELAVEFGKVSEYPYLTVATTSSHDTSPLRAWWEEDKTKTEHYYKSVMNRSAKPPKKLGSEMAQEILARHLASPSLWAIFPLQDILAMSPSLTRTGDPKNERINDPSDPENRWKYRIHLPLEELLKKKDFLSLVKNMLAHTGRLKNY